MECLQTADENNDLSDIQVIEENKQDDVFVY